MDSFSPFLNSITLNLIQMKWFVVQDNHIGEVEILIGSDDPHKAVACISVGLSLGLANYIVDLHNKCQRGD